MNEYLKLSSLHLTQEDADLLSVYHDNPPIRVKNLEDGITVSIPGFSGRQEITDARLQKLREAGHSEGFVEIVRWAGARNAWQVRFDESGKVHPDFPIGGWTPVPGFAGP